MGPLLKRRQRRQRRQRRERISPKRHKVHEDRRIVDLVPGGASASASPLVIRVPTGVQPFAVAEYKNFRDPAGGYGPLTFELSLVQIVGV
jgi:hypothetical protein